MPRTLPNIRLFAAIHGDVLHPKAHHVIGFPTEIGADNNKIQKLPSPDVLVIEQEAEGSVFLYRMTRGGKPGGDTWHQSINDAKHQAEYEYGQVLGDWQPIPESAVDARDFAIKTIGGKVK